MQIPWRTVGWVTLDAAGIILCLAGIDCLRVGLRGLRRGERPYDRQIGLLTAVTGAVLLLAGGGLLWWAHVLRLG